MIRESGPWRSQLIRDANTIERWSRRPKITEHRSFILENKIFLAAYAMRKLFQARKLSSSFEQKNIKLKTFPAFNRSAVTSWNADKFDELYDLHHPTKEKISARHLLDVIIHSLVLVEVVRRDDSVGGFLVTSDHRSAALWSVTVRQFVSLMRSVANDQPAAIYRERIGDTERWDEWRGNTRAIKRRRRDSFGS